MERKREYVVKELEEEKTEIEEGVWKEAEIGEGRDEKRRQGTQRLTEHN